MSEVLRSGRRASGQRFLALCVFLGLSVWAPSGVGAETLDAKSAFEPLAESNQRDTKITLTFRAPRAFGPAGGDARLLSSIDQRAEDLQGTFEAVGGVVTATFQAQRGWVDKSFPFIELASQQFVLKSPVEVAKIKPRTLNAQPDFPASTEKAQAFRVTSNEELENGARLCGDGPSVKQATLQVKTNEAAIERNGLNVHLAIHRPEAELPDATLVLEVCKGSTRWVYSGSLETLRPTPGHLLDIEVKHGSGGSVSLILRPDIVATGSAGEAKVLEGPEKLAGLSLGEIVSFRKEGDAYLAKVPVDCTAGELALGKLTFLVRDDQGDVRLFQHPGGVAVCPPLGFWSRIKANFVTWIIISSVCLALLGGAGYLIYKLLRIRRFDRGRSHQALDIGSSWETVKATHSTSQVDLEDLKGLLSDILVQGLAPLEEGIKELKRELADVQKRTLDFPDSPTADLVMRERKSQDGSASSSEGMTDSGLAALVNRWWKEGADRARAEFLLQSRSVRAYRSLDINESLRSLTKQTFMFQVTDGPMEWLGQQQQEELLVVPCDPRLFETGDSLKFLGILFEGIILERSLTKVRFRCVKKPCRLHRDSGSKDCYRLVQRGQIEMEGRADLANTARDVQSNALVQVTQGSSPTPEDMTEAKLARIVQGAIFEAIPRDLPVRVEELARQVRSLREHNFQRAEPAQLEPSLIAALEAMRKGIAAWDGELRAHASVTQEVKSLVEKLSRDFGHIGSEIRHSDPALPIPQGRFFSKPIEILDTDAAVDRLKEGPAQPSLQEGSLDMMGASWRSGGLVNVLPEQVSEKLDEWWPVELPVAESSPDADQLPESSTYLWRLEETQRVLARVSRQRGWEVNLVHLSVPDGPAPGDALLLITEPVALSKDYRSASFRGSSFADALLFQFALSIHGDAGSHIALLPAAGLRVDKHHHAYFRLTLGRLPESATRLTKVIRPAVLGPAGQGGLYTVASPLKAEFR